MEMISYSSVHEAIASVSPNNPIHVYRPRALAQAVHSFKEGFPGKILYAVKTNPAEHVLKDIAAGGIMAFDVASLAEIETVQALLPDAELYFMHTVKSRHAIREAYFTHRVRHFAIDTHQELHKILTETNYAKDIALYVRLAIPNNYAELTLADKFGIALSEAPELIKAARRHTSQLGICFHVGSQCMHPDAYRIALRLTRQAIQDAGVPIETVDVGGGFPSVYPGMTPVPLTDYFETIRDALAGLQKIVPGCKLLCEPGRALVAESGSVVAQVILRKGNQLYINDGTYGSLFDAGIPKFIFPVRKVSASHPDVSHLVPFSFFGPTCDTLDFMKGPFYLPADMKEGDYIELGQLGAYGRTLATGFNGFLPEERMVAVDEPPLMSMYNADTVSEDTIEILAA